MTDRRSVTDLGDQDTSCSDCVLFSLCFAHDILPDEQDRLGGMIRRRQAVERDEHIHHGGQHARHLAVLRTGSVKAYQITPEGDEIVSGFFLPGDIIGLDALSEGSHSGFAVALEESRMCDIPMAEFQKMLDESPRLNRVMFRLLSEEMVEARQLLLVVGRLDAKTRVALFLLSLSQRLARRNLDPDHFRLTMDRRDIANYLGLTIETVSRTLSALQRDRVIEVRGKQVRVLDREALETLAQQPVEANKRRQTG